jgi:hypothetical protein
MSPEGLPDPLLVAVAFSGTLDRLGIRHLIGGSMASSVHGEPRTTNDIDIVADLRAEHLEALLAAVGSTYYVSRSTAREAIRRKTSFNLIHLGLAVKVDLFIAGDDALNVQRLRSLRRVRVSEEPEAWLPIDTPEHSILRKLEWFRRGGEVSERQWRDVTAMIRLQGEALDTAYLRSWAPRLQITDLLERALAERK